MLGIAKLVAKDNVRLYASSPLFGMIYMQDDQPTDFIDAGRCLERVWLTATRLGLHIQPTAALLYLAQRAREGEGSFFSKTHQELILKAESSIKTIFDVPQGKVPVMLMRIGKGDAPTVRSYKRPPHLLSDIECAKNNI